MSLATMEHKNLFKIFSASKIGTQKHKNINEDGIRYKVFGNCSVIVLCDGHGFSNEYHRGNSNQVVDLVLDSLIDNSSREATRDFEKKLVNLGNRPTKNELKSVLSSTFRILNDMITEIQNLEFERVRQRHSSGIDDLYNDEWTHCGSLGTAMTCILVFRNNDIYVAYRGDSPVFVGYNDGAVKKITMDHNVYNKNETDELKREIREPRLIERLGFLAQHCLEPDLKGGVTVTRFFGNTIPKRIRGFKLFGDIVEEDPENYRQIEEYTTMTELVTVNNQNMNISFMILCSNGISNWHNFLKKFYECIKNTDTTGTRKEAIVESLERQIENFVNQYIRNSNTGDDSTIAFMLFTNQHGSFNEAYDNFLRTEFSITPDTEITNHVSNLNWRDI